MLKRVGKELFNLPVILRLLDAEALTVAGGSERTFIELVRRLVSAQDKELDKAAKLIKRMGHTASCVNNKRSPGRYACPRCSFLANRSGERNADNHRPAS